MPGFKDDLTSFYKFTTPVDLLGKIQFKDLDGKKSSVKLAEEVFEICIQKGYDSKTIIEKCEGNRERQYASLAGAFNGLYQPKGQSLTKYISNNYWGRPSKEDPREDPDAPKTVFDNNLSDTKNYYLNVCHVTSPTTTTPPNASGATSPKNEGPPIDFGINVFRAPMLSLARANVNEIEFFLNSMPPIFANQLMPYCDVEFQLPTLKQLRIGEGTSEIDPTLVNRPSLYRFLVGSGIKLDSLTEADKSLAAFVTPKQEFNNSAKNTAAYVGTEFFTTPQTLTNMDSLKGGPSRAGDVKPFLPPATITGVSISDKNVGGTFTGRTASMTIKIHDKARLPEFSEFIRGPQGYNDVTIWITYGLLAPRGRGDDDAYAKFINENMLTREGYIVTNSSFTFADDGSVDVTLSLHYKTRRRLDFATINSTDDNLRSVLDKAKRIFAEIAKTQNSYGPPRVANQGYGQSEIRIAQLISNAAEENLDPGAEPAKLAAQIQEVEALLNSQLKSKKISKNREGLDPKVALKLLEDLKKLYGINVNDKSFKEQIESAALGFIKRKFELALKSSSPDPFFPTARKNATRRLPGTNLSTTSKVYSDRFISECTLANPRADRTYLSFGKIFSVFCIPSILSATKQEFGIEDSTASSPVEVQFNFYQLNSKCGPASNHNIAEFPIDMAMFQDAFSKIIASRGGENFTVEEFFSFMQKLFIDRRQPGYGMRNFYAPYDPKKPEAKALQGTSLESNMNTWYATYKEFVEPSLAVEIEVFEASEYRSKVDLLYKLQDRVGGEFTSPIVTKKKEDSKIIVRYNIYDRNASPYENLNLALSVDADGEYLNYNADFKSELEQISFASFFGGQPKYQVINGKVMVGDQVVATSLGRGKDALKESLGSVVPKLDIGGNGSLIYSAQLASKTSGAEGTVALQGGAFKVNPALTPNGLAMEQNKMVLTVLPANLTMTTMGCTLLRPFQQFFIDFGTNTTIDNIYTISQIQHSIAPGKFESSLTFIYTDGYARLRSAGTLSSHLENLKNALQTKNDSVASQTAPGAPIDDVENFD